MVIFGDPDRAFAQRKDTMALDTIHPEDVPRGKVNFIKDQNLSLKTDDIARCAPFYPWKQYLDKPSFQLRSDIPGSETKPLYSNLTRVKDLSLTTADIEWAQPKITRFNTNRCTDPLQPQYKLPECPVRPITPPRGNGKDSLNIDDIEMSKPKRVIPDRNYVRDPNDSTDIEYTCPNYRRRVTHPLNPEANSTSLNVMDINAFPGRTTLPRGTNPLDPVYNVSQASATSLPIRWSEEEGRVYAPPLEVEVIGEVPQSKPRKLQWDNGEPFFALLTEDIAGAAPQRWVGSVPFNVYDPPEKKPIISFHEPQDIPGTQVGSLRKGIVTGRMTNPLNPRYTMLDGPARMHPLAERADPDPGSVMNTDVRTMLPADFKQRTQFPTDAMPKDMKNLTLPPRMPQSAPAPSGTLSNTQAALEAALVRAPTPLSNAGQAMAATGGSARSSQRGSARSSRSAQHLSSVQKMDAFIQR
jgi:hypothetical protein